MRNRRLIRYAGMVIVLTFAMIMVATNMAAAAPVSEEGSDAPKIENTKEPENTKGPEVTKEPEEKIFFNPKILVESYTIVEISGEGGNKDDVTSTKDNAPEGTGDKAAGNLADVKTSVVAGSNIRVNIKLKNTSKDTDIKNMTTVISMPDNNFELLSVSDTKYYETFKANTTLIVSYEISVSDKIPSGQYTFPIAYDFADERGGQGGGSGYARATISQPVKIEFTQVVMPPDVVMGDTVMLGFQALNMGNESVYNVRAKLEGNGFTPLETMYIGEIAGNNQGNGTMKVQMSGLRGDAIYGATKADIAFYYEDKDGKEYTQTQEINTNISSPFSPETNEEEEENQWWIVMIIVGVCLAGFMATFIIRAIKRSRM